MIHMCRTIELHLNALLTQMLMYSTSRGVSFCLKENVVCRETPVLLSFYSGSLGYGFNEMFVREGYRLGKIAVAMVNRSGCRTELPRT
jgi:hypothetical protein